MAGFIPRDATINARFWPRADIRSDARNVLFEAKQTLINHLGYWVNGSRKMDYKSRFLPQERLSPDGWARVEV